MQPRILIATTTWWAMPARLALAFSQCGSQVSCLCPRGSPISKIQSLREEFRYGSVDPLSSLLEAIRSADPALIVPCDDRVVGHLHRLHAGEVRCHDLAAVRELIETSLGDPAGYPFMRSRSKLLQLARESGLAVPETKVLCELHDVRQWVNEHGFPLVLKADGTWGGSGVRVARSWAEAEHAYTELRQPVSASSILSHLSFHDFFPVFSLDQERNRELTVQTYIHGECGNAMFTCWKGDVVDSLSADVVLSQKELGASSIVRTGQNDQMEHAGRLLVRELQISGFCGLDFVTEHGTGNVYLIELNPRATQLGHLQPGGKTSLVEALLRELAGEPRLRFSGSAQETIAFFPQSPGGNLGVSPTANLELHHDIPSNEPALIRELRRASWNTRHLSAFVYIGIRKLLRLFSGSARGDEEQAGSSEIKIT